MKVCCLITGRGNNTLKDKNIRDVLGHPVMYYGANAAVKSGCFDHLYCSSDDEKILAEAAKLGYEKIKRPAELALPTAQHVDALTHALGVMKERGYEPDIMCVLLANNVTVTSQMVKDCVNQLKADYEHISSVNPVYVDKDHHPLRCKKLDANGNIIPYEDIHGKVSTNRQDLPYCCFLAFNFWVINVKKFLAGDEGIGPWSFLGSSAKPYEIEESIDIHDAFDLIKAAHWVEENYKD